MCVGGGGRAAERFLRALGHHPRYVVFWSYSGSILDLRGTSCLRGWAQSVLPYAGGVTIELEKKNNNGKSIFNTGLALAQ